MTVETNAQFISALNKSYPTNRDLIKEGDDHIRLVKSVLQNTFPGMDKAVTADADKLNKLDATLTYDEETLNINNNIQLKEGKTADFGGATLEGVGDPKEPTDAVNLQSLQGTLMWPVGSIFFTVDARNPKEILGFGTWEKFAQGRMIVGVGTTTDAANDTRTVINEAKGGTYAAKLTEKNIPPHTHPLGDAGATQADGAHSHVFRYLEMAKPSPDTKHDGLMAQYNVVNHRTETDGAHTHKLTGTTETFGAGEAFDIIPPYIACNIWKRLPDEPTP